MVYVTRVAFIRIYRRVDDLLHSCHWASGAAHNNVTLADIFPRTNATGRSGTHHLAERVTAGRAVALDYNRWHKRKGTKVLKILIHSCGMRHLSKNWNKSAKIRMLYFKKVISCQHVPNCQQRTICIYLYLVQIL